MKHGFHITASLLVVVGAVLAQRHNHHGWSGLPPGAPGSVTQAPAATTTVTVAFTPISNSGSSVVKQTPAQTPINSGSTGTTATYPSGPTVAPTGTGTGGNGGGSGGGAMTISIVNSYSTALSLAFDSNSGVPPPIGNPTATTIGQGATTFYSFPTGWAGRIYVGKTTAAANSKIEGSVTGPPDMDTSYVDGYSVPIVCTSAGKVSGCNIELFGYNGNYCNQTDHNIQDFTLCTNPKVDHDDGTADPFFAPCAHVAYTYPSDNSANQANVDVTTHCCIGTSCSSTSSKRDLLSMREEAAYLELLQAHRRYRDQRYKPRSHVHRLVQDARLRR